jgi:uncharacterized protein (DUF58 family)
MNLSDEFLLMLERLSIAARRLTAGLPHGTHLTRRRGASVEFREHRPYSPGDELRYIDWNAAARLGQPFVKEFAAEEAVHVAILLDASASMAFGAPPKIETARTVAAALAYIGLAGLDSVSLFSFADRLRPVAPSCRGKHAVLPLLRALETVRPEGRTDFRACLADPPSELHPRSILFLLTDFYDRDGYAEALRALRRRRFELNLIHLVCPEELEPPGTGRLLLEDLETGERRRVTLTPGAREAYRRRLDRYLASLESFALENELSYARVSSADPAEQTITRILRQSRMLQRRK